MGDDRVLVIARIFGEGKAGEPLSLLLGHVWELREGKLLRGTVYLDPQEALDAVEAARRLTDFPSARSAASGSSRSRRRRTRAARRVRAGTSCTSTTRRPPCRRGSSATGTGGAYLILKRNEEPFAGEWDLPGGFVEIGETPGEAVVREVIGGDGARL